MDINQGQKHNFDVLPTRLWQKFTRGCICGVYLTCSPQSSPTEDGQKMHPLQNMEDGGRHYSVKQAREGKSQEQDVER